MKSAYDLANEISRTCVERIRGQYSFNIKTCSGAIEARDSEHAATLNRLIESLHKIASWNDGEIVKGAFDSPNDAREARSALGAIGIWGPPTKET